jgi:hypothetical protein
MTRRLCTVLGALAGAVVVLVGLAPTAGAAQRTTGQVHRMADGTVVAGSHGTVVSNSSGVTLSVATSDLAPNEPHTVWWVVFNHPDQCSDPFAPGFECGPGDLERPGVKASVLYATGSISGGNGHAGFGARLQVGDTSGALFGPGLLNPRGAEIHLVLRTHGPTVPGMVNEQLRSFNGGCDEGQPNEGLCDDVQFAAFAQ